MDVPLHPMRTTWVSALAFLLLFSSDATAACITYDRSAWTQEQKNLAQAIAYRLVFEAGQNIVPTVNGDEFCFAASSVTLPTASQILTRFAQEEAARDAADQVEATRQTAFDAEISGNDWCTAELADLDTRINQTVATLQGQLDASANSVAGVKAHLRNQLYPTLGVGFKKVARCLRARVR